LKASLFHLLQKIIVLGRETGRSLGNLRCLRFGDRCKYLAAIKNSQQTKATDLKKELPSRKAFLRKFIFFRAHQLGLDASISTWNSE
jgi:hypothetical protein